MGFETVMGFQELNSNYYYSHKHFYLYKHIYQSLLFKIFCNKKLPPIDWKCGRYWWNLLGPYRQLGNNLFYPHYTLILKHIYINSNITTCKFVKSVYDFRKWIIIKLIANVQRVFTIPEAGLFEFRKTFREINEIPWHSSLRQTNDPHGRLSPS